MKITECVFKRNKEDDPWEYGLIVLDGLNRPKLIIDKKYNIIHIFQVFDYLLQTHCGYYVTSF